MKMTINESDTTWFYDGLKPDDVYVITDTDDGLMIKENNYNSSFFWLKMPLQW